jgi:shikimate kinase
MNENSASGASLDNGGNLILVGLMGAGKTSVGKVLARRMQRDFVDSDAEIEKATGVRIPVIFEIEGEAGFRSREERIIKDLCDRQNIVLATGGGAVLSPANRQCLRGSGLVIYLCATPEALWRRTSRDRNRPLLRTSDPLQKLRKLHTLRDPLYRTVAHLVVDTGSQSVGTLATHILRLLGQGPTTAAPG